jgi:hypothetical protein
MEAGLAQLWLLAFRTWTRRSVFAPLAPLRAPRVSAQLIAVAFLLLDAGAVVAALCWLHRQRCIADITDLRYRNHPDRPRRTLSDGQR